MNLKRIASEDWQMPSGGRLRSISDDKERQSCMKYTSDFLLKYYFMFKHKAEHDQKLLNIIFHYNPSKINTVFLISLGVIQYVCAMYVPKYKFETLIIFLVFEKNLPL